MFSSIDIDHNNNNDPESIACIKRRGASLARADFDRQSSLSSSTREQLSKRNSVLDPTKLENNQTGGTKLINFFKSGLHLSKLKSKSKANLQEKRQSLYNDSHSAKSEENLMGFESDSYITAIRASNLVLNKNDPTLYTTTLTSDGESIYKPVVLLDRECRVQSIHPSIVSGQSHCFQIIKTFKSEITESRHFHSINVNRDGFATSQIIKSCSYNSPLTDLKSAPRSCESVNIIRCSSATQKNEWIMRIKKHINPNMERIVRHEDILRIWIQEAKNLISKKRYFCEIRLDQMLYGRTSIKIMNDSVFWGEEFEFTGLETVSTISVSIYRMIDIKRKREKPELIALINLSCGDVLQNSFAEKWYSPSADLRASSNHLRYSHSKNLNINTHNSDDAFKSVIDSTPMLRIKARYRPLEIIPTNYYNPLINYIVTDNVCLVMSLENHLKVKSKEELMNSLIFILQRKDRHIQFLSDLVLVEVLRAEDNLVLRGNSMASKAMECYLKVIGEKYLYVILSDTIAQITTQEVDCEVDPLRIQNLKDQSVIVNNQRKLMMLVEGVWIKIFNSAHLLPKDLKSVFSIIREKMSNGRRSSSNNFPMIDQVISSCLFLRLICPAIMSPFLFGLAKEYPEKPCINRTFTLVAKCIQSLANFSQSYNGKEVYMSFLQEFLTKNTKQMHIFLKQISSDSSFIEPKPISDNDSIQYDSKSHSSHASVDLGYHLADLSHQLSYHLRGIPIKDYTEALSKIRSVLESISKTFPSFDMDKADSFTNISSINQFRSHIPVPLHRTVSALSSILQADRKSLELGSIPCSLRTEDDEDFSYIPTKYSSMQPICREGIFKSGNENYVDFESIELKVYDEPFIEDYSPPMPSLLSKYLNEKEINDHWTKVVKESCNHSTSGDTYVYPLDTNNCTINSSGYESLNFPPKFQNEAEVRPLTIQTQSPQFVGQFSEDQNSLSRQVNSLKLAPARQANIYRRIKRNSNAQTTISNSSDTKVSDKTKISSSNLCLSLNASCDTLGSIDNLSGTGNKNLKSSKSMSSVFQKKGLNNKTNQLSFNNDRSKRDYTHSQENLESSMVKLFRNSSKSLSNSISSNVDLDSFVSNELTRLQLFFEYFHIEKPSMYQGNAVEQYKCKTLDENHLKRALVKRSHLNHADIANHIKCCYRLLKTINKPGQISSEIVIKSVMQMNQQIQTFVRDEYQRTQLPKNNEVCLKIRKENANLDSFTLSTQSLPPPLSKYSNPSPKHNVTCAISRQLNSSVNLSKSLTVHDVFERY